MKKAIVIAAVAAACAAGGWYFWQQGRSSGDGAELVLYGNVDIRQVSLAFEASGRITELAAEEGDAVKAGQVLAKLDTRTLELQEAQARAQASVAEQTLLKLRNGSRPQEIAEAREKVKAAAAETARTAQDLKRAQALWDSPAGRAVSRQSLDAAVSASSVAKANEAAAKEALKLAEIGPRSEDIAAAAASLEQARAQVALLAHQVSLGTLYAPQDAVVRSRLLEKGDMASAAKAVYTLALTDPKWVRVYVSEKDLGRVKPGMKAEITTDSNPGKALEGTVGYISSVSEFTPKNVQTEDLRTSLVYETRVLFKDPASELRLGQPATVRIRFAEAGASSPAAQN